MFKKRRTKGNDTVETMILITILGGLAVTVLMTMAHTMSDTASQHAVPIIQSVQLDKYLH